MIKFIESYKNQFKCIPVILGAICFLLLSSAQPADASVNCGPGTHWMDTCTGGYMYFDVTSTTNIDANFDSIIDYTYTYTGTSTVFLGNPIEGDPSGDPGHLNYINFEIIDYYTTGSGQTVILGDGIGNLSSDGPLYSPGNISEQTGDSSLADISYNVFFEVIGTPYGTLHNNSPQQFLSVIDEFPTILTLNSIAPVTLYNSSNSVRGQIFSSTTTMTPIVPEPISSTLFIVGAAALGFRRFRKC